MADEPRKARSIFIPPEFQDLWDDLEALAGIQGRPVSGLVNDAIAEFSLLSAYRAGRERERSLVTSEI